MVRAPCCEKMGLKKGPWTGEEDQILISYIQSHGHGIWRALPKLAGLLRCGKSCRLRWTNYLNPDIKRGNFTGEEEDAIITLHQMLGYGWSAIAAKLPGRTDNEIKNVWHTHLKKRLTTGTDTTQKSARKNKIELKEEKPTKSFSSPDVSYSGTTDSTTSSTVENSQNSMESSLNHEFQEIDESFWIKTLQMDGNAEQNSMDSMELIEGFSSEFSDEPFLLSAGSRDEDDMSYWLRIFLQAEELPEI